MKVLVQGVLLGVFLLTVEANHCRKVDWWHSFDKRGWSRCSHSTEYLNGIYRNDNKGHNDGLYLIEEGWCCKAPSPNQHQPSHCKIANWWSVLDRNHHWALCPKGYFLQGFYRTDGQWLGNIENGRCCRPNNLPDKYRHCYVKNVYRAFDHKGWNRCMKDYYLVGLYRGSCHYLGCIELFKCCSMIVDVNKCNQKPCKNGATCVDLQGAGYRCNCKSGFTGKNCEQDINECEASPCKNGATCENLSGSYHCKCKSGYAGKNCEEDIDECLDEPCKNGGTCVNILGSYRCNCPSGFTGRECEKDIDECVDEPCKNGATCLNLPGSYRCDCKSGYHGKNCEKDINECLNQPCKNEATCVNLPGSYRCKCTSGFIGRNCETDKDECLGNPCKNGATCMNIPGSYRCKCTSAYTGRNCEKDINECLDKPCKNGGKCVNLPGSYRCNCKVGFTGRHCEKDINECLEKPCKNGATCVNHPGTYSCNCKGGFMGRHCQIDIDECFEECNPCKNRAKCVNLQGSYRCDCKPGYSGINCEIDFEGVGCYKDTAERAISSLEGKDPSLDGNYKTRKNPIAKCAMVARKRGYRVFAVQDGGWCAASATAEETFNKYGKSSACKLDGQGGPWANEVYVFQEI